jgi:pimeloyl-ACP methyl ester carboxylesterase
MTTAKIKTVTEAPEGAPWLVMVHGATQNSDLFSAQRPAFSRDFRLALVDLPGHGRSTDVPGPYGPVEYAAAVSSALSTAGVTRFHYWGTHTGAAVGLLLALESPERVASLVLEGAVVPDEPMPYVSGAILRARRTAGSTGAGAAVQEWFETAAWFDAIRLEPISRRAAEHRAMLETFSGAPWLDELEPAEPPPVREKLRTLRAPTLLINGEFDLPEFISVADLLEEELPQTVRAIIPAGGGFPLWEQPDLVNAAVFRFLSSNLPHPWNARLSE